MEERITSLDHSAEGFQSSYGQVLNWLHQTMDLNDLKNELVIYADRIGMREIAESIPITRIGVEGKIAFCLNRGARLAPASADRVKALLDEYQEGPPEGRQWFEDLPDTPGGKAIRAYVNCYSRLDNAKTRVLRGNLDPRELSAETRRIVSLYAQGKTAIIKQLADHYRDGYLESRQDPSVDNWTKPIGTIVETLHFMLSNRASIRSGAKVAKARKLRSTLETYDRKGERAATKVSYKDEDRDLGIRSVDPTHLVGASAAVIYNAKNRHCEVYHAKLGSQLSIQGARIVNFDEHRSQGRTLRKPSSDLQHWTRATTVKRLDVLMDGTKGKRWEVTGKLNKNCVIVKVL